MGWFADWLLPVTIKHKQTSVCHARSYGGEQLCRDAFGGKIFRIE